MSCGGACLEIIGECQFPNMRKGGGEGGVEGKQEGGLGREAGSDRVREREKKIKP